MTTLLTARGLTKSYPLRNPVRGARRVVVLDGVDIEVGRAETVAVVGESGAGKSTLGRILLGLITPDAGTIHFSGTDISRLRGRALRHWRTRARMVFQDPYSSLDPRMVIGDAIAEPLAIHSVVPPADRRQRVAELLERVGLDGLQYERYPHEFSGGQLQRVAIARAIATEPDLIVCDEPVSALDMSIRAQVVNLFLDLQQDCHVSYVFISHDLSLVRLIAPHVVVLYRGRIVEQGDTQAVFQEPAHPYTRALIRAIPTVQAQQEPVFSSRDAGSVSDDDSLSAGGCPYRLRCPLAIERCAVEVPPLLAFGQREVACHRVADAADTPSPARAGE